MIDTEQLRSAVGSVVPALERAELSPAGSGQCYDAWWIGDRHVVRVAKGEDCARALAVEMEVLPELAEAIDAAIPMPVGLGEEPSTGRRFLVHEAVPGVPLLPPLRSALSAAQRRTLAAALGRFLVQLQGQRVAPAAVSLPEARYHAVLGNREVIERVVFPRMIARHVDACRAIADAFEPCPRSAWVLVHSDLYDHHILLRADDRTLRGVIDFGDLSEGDPACDLSTLMDDFGLDFVQEVARAFPAELVAALLLRARFYCVWEALLWAAEELAEGRSAEVDENSRRVGELATVDLIGG